MSERRPHVSGDVLATAVRTRTIWSVRVSAPPPGARSTVSCNRNVGVELLPADDPRGADHFLEAARRSTSVTDHRFLRVLDLLAGRGRRACRGARVGQGLRRSSQLLAQSPLPNRRAAAIVAEVAEAIAHAHERGLVPPPAHAAPGPAQGVRRGPGRRPRRRHRPRAGRPPGLRRRPRGLPRRRRPGPRQAALRLPGQPVARRPCRRAARRSHRARTPAAPTAGARGRPARRRRHLRPHPRNPHATPMTPSPRPATSPASCTRRARATRTSSTSRSATT